MNTYYVNIIINYFAELFYFSFALNSIKFYNWPNNKELTENNSHDQVEKINVNQLFQERS
jgi:hypothetical protein